MAAASLAGAPAIASDETDVVTVINQFNDAGNRGDLKAYVALCADQVAIIDMVPPHVWQGASACQDNWNAVIAWEARNGITDGGITLARPLHVEITGDRAYVVAPAANAVIRNGAKADVAADWTFALRKYPSGWRITAWAWAKR
jgi:ketosteroid isomerase-like protein